jgi:hypothetical protein
MTLNGFSCTIWQFVEFYWCQTYAPAAFTPQEIFLVPMGKHVSANECDPGTNYVR